MNLNVLSTENRQNAKTENNSLKLSKSPLIKTTLSILISLLVLTTVFGQSKQYTNNTADQNLRGSGTVNSSTLAMEFRLPLGGYPGRGINLPINLNYSSKVWRMEYSGMSPGTNVTPCWGTSYGIYSENTASGWTTSMAVPYISFTGQLKPYDDGGTIYDDTEQPACDPGGEGGNIYTKQYIRRITLYLPGGESHELRLDDTPVGGGASWDGTYYAADSSNIKYVQNSSSGIYKVLMPDGSFYDIDSTTKQATKFTDRNGNYITYHAANSTYPNGYVTDTLGKDVPIPIKPQAPTSAGTQTYSMPGIDGTIDYTLHWKQLKGSSAEESGLTNFSDSLRYMSNERWSSTTGWVYRSAGTFLFQSEHLSNMVVGYLILHNPIVLTQIDTPTGEKYKFSYNVFGELEKIKYPTGGEEVFEYNAVEAVSAMEAPYAQANRGVTNHKVYETAGTGTPSEWQYSTPASGIVKITNPDNTKNVRYLQGGDVDSNYGYDNVLAGMPYREMTFSSSGQLQTQKITYWTKSNNQWQPRVLREDNIVYDSSGNGLSSTGTYEYEGNLSYKETPVLVNKTTAYAFETASAGSISYSSLPSATIPTLPSAPSTPIKIAESTYLINDANYSATASYYTDQNMIGLVTINKVKDGSGNIVSQSETTYDESGFSPDYRGNPTTSKVWDSTKGAVTSSGAYTASHSKFDGYGNQYEATDALGNATTTTFDSTYHAFPLTVTTAAPDQNGGTYGSTTGFTTSATFDTTTGLQMTATGINGIITKVEYDSDTLRPTVTKSAYGTSNEVHTEYEYGVPDSTSGVYSSAQRFAKVRSQIDADNWKEAYYWVDGLGRSIKGKVVDSRGDVFSETEYDIMGRVKRSTNPYKSGETKLWTTPTYDDYGRTIQVTSPDSTHVDVSFGISTSGVVGITKTVTDQAGKKRKGITDDFGRMIRVIEDPDGQNLATDYVFDTLGNLRKTTQGDQIRYFSYDSLGRLLRAKQIEQDVNSALALPSADPVTGNNSWTLKYEYDDNGNITSTTDALNKSVTATYDHLNRLIIRNYSDTATPDVAFYYDGKGLSSVPNYSKGKTTKVTSSVSENKYTSFDNMGRLLSSQQITDGVTYDFEYAYNLSGALIEETYPSTRKVKYSINTDGALSMVQSKKNSGAGYYAYAMGFDYNSDGSLKKMRLGNGHWETYLYNDRLQVRQIGLGITDTTQNILKLEFAYGQWESGTLNTGKNNGSLAEQIITVPNSAGNSDGFTATQKYTYDGLNRLESAAETVSSSQTWKQTFTYDRYGNRRFDTSGSNTTTLPSGCTTAVCNPTFPTDNTNINRFASGQGYSYDANGSLTEDGGGNRFGYDSEGRQKEFFVSTNSTTTPDATYYYDGNGKRVKKISSTEITVFVYDGGGQLAAEYSTAQAATQQVSYLTTDHLGSPRIITNENGAVTKRQDFAAFGDETVTSQRISSLGYTTTDELRQDYTGYQKDEESGLEYAQARYYNAQHGRFTSVDPLPGSATIRNPQSFNRYSYVLNSPYKFTDPLGLLPLKSASACGNFCRNSDYIDGSAFRGRDTSMVENMIADLELNRQVRLASERLDSADFDNQFTSNVTASEKAVIKKSLKRMLNVNNGVGKFMAINLILGGATFNVDNIQDSGMTGIINVEQLNKDLKNLCFTYTYAFRFVQITLDRTEFSNVPWVEQSILGNLMHEGEHAYHFALILSAWSSAGTKSTYDMSIYEDEKRSTTVSIEYLKIMGGTYVDFLKLVQFVDSKGTVNEPLIANKGNQAIADFAPITTVGELLKSYKVIVPQK